jgi:hypothetical protein
LGDFGEALCFTAAAIEEPDLALASVARGEKGEIFAVGAPSGVRGGDSFDGHGDGIAAMSGDYPEALLAFIFLKHAGSDGIGDPLAVGAQFGLSDIADLEVVVDGDAAGSAWSRGRWLGGRLLGMS